MTKTVMMIMLIAALSSGLTACGRAGSPVPPEGSTYPQEYPTE